MKKKKNTGAQFVSEASIPAGVYPELDRDLGRTGVKSRVPAVNLGLWSTTDGVPFPVGLPIFENDLARANLENDIPAADLEGQRTDPYLS